MTDAILLCTDGSALSIDALRRGLELLASDAPVVLVTVIEREDPTLVTGSGMAGGVMTEEELADRTRETQRLAQTLLGDTARELGLVDAEMLVLGGTPGPAICGYAEERPAAAIVIGSRGHGGLKRALLGSVSDHVVRNATCPVVVVNASTTPEA